MLSRRNAENAFRATEKPPVPGTAPQDNEPLELGPFSAIGPSRGICTRCPRRAGRKPSPVHRFRRLLAERGPVPPNLSKVRRMSFVVINAVTVSDESRDEFEERFARRAGTVSGAPGFEAFELLKPLGDGRYL